MGDSRFDLDHSFVNCTMLGPTMQLVPPLNMRTRLLSRINEALRKLTSATSFEGLSLVLQHNVSLPEAQEYGIGRACMRITNDLAMPQPTKSLAQNLLDSWVKEAKGNRTCLAAAASILPAENVPNPNVLGVSPPMQCLRPSAQTPLRRPQPTLADLGIVDGCSIYLIELLAQPKSLGTGGPDVDTCVDGVAKKRCRLAAHDRQLGALSLLGGASSSSTRSEVPWAYLLSSIEGWGLEEFHSFLARAQAEATRVDCARVEATQRGAMLARIPESVRRLAGLPVDLGDLQVLEANAQRAARVIAEVVREGSRAWHAAADAGTPPSVLRPH